MKGIYCKVVNSIIPILKEDKINSSLILRNKPDNINDDNLEDNYNITILEEFNKIPSKVLHKKDQNLNSNLSVYIKKTKSSKSKELDTFSLKARNKKINYRITKVIFSEEEKSRGVKRQREENYQVPKTEKRSRSYSESFLDTPIADNKFSFDNLVSATKTRNFILDDGVLDFLDYYSRNPKKHSLTFNEIVGFESGYNTRSKNDSTNIQRINYGSETLNNMIKDEGIKYEKKVMDELTEKCNNSSPKISIETVNTSLDIKGNYEITRKMISEGKEVLYQAVLYNEYDNTFGCPDLIVRSDIVERLFGDSYVTTEIKNRFENESLLKYFYIVIDIKHSHLDFNSDERTLRNTETLKPYKSQLCVYNNALSKIQGFDCKIALVLGKSYSVKNTKFYDYFNKLGVIDYKDRDSEYISKTEDAVNWIKRVREDGKYWVLNPIPSVKELFPRMNNEKDGKWKAIKQKVADNVGEISSVYYCGIKERKSAHSNNIYSWRDERCNSANLGFNQNSKSNLPSTIDKILDINRSDNTVLPNNIKTRYIDSFEWRTINTNSMEFYLDFETLNSNFSDFSNNSYENVIIFQVGVGYMNSEGKWIYKSFVSKNKSFVAEKEMLLSFFKFIEECKTESQMQNCHFVHWYPHERICYDKIKSSMNLPNIKFMDLSKLFREEPIVVKGSLRYKLKSISSALFKMNLIDTSWDFSSECNSGLAAMALANKVYNELDALHTEVDENNEIMKEIIKYNEVDCKVLWDILKYLRKNH